MQAVSRTSGSPGDEFELVGAWGDSQGTKLPSINMGASHRLHVASWTSTVLKVRIPQELEPGAYKVGVYCNDPMDPGLGGSYSTSWVDFEVK